MPLLLLIMNPKNARLVSPEMILLDAASLPLSADAKVTL